MFGGTLKGSPEGAGVPDVQQSRRRRRQPAAIRQVLRIRNRLHQAIVEARPLALSACAIEIATPEDIPLRLG